ncbi:MAG TPA: hypothetical protein P5044_11995, partial [bacterium]|nr:hypothetical protein [bacterium]
MKKLFILLVAMLFAVLMISCGDKSSNDPVNDNEVADEATDEIVTDEVVTDEIATDETAGDEDEIVCTLDTAWMAPEDSWESWGYLKMMGPIGEYQGTEYVPAVFTDGKITLAEMTKELIDGSYMNYQGTVLLANPAAYTFINQTSTSATADYWDAMYQFSAELIPAMKEEGVREAGFGATIFFRHSYIDLTISGTSITGQFTRKNCFLALSKTEEQIIEEQPYDVPIGDMYGCFDKNVDGSVGEDLKMMFKNQLTEDEAALLEFFNTKEDGTVAVYGDPDYT